ncbi:MAG: hypothetical protein NZ570_04610 [Candidatus Caldarchaeum sp.]|nr:hypothetical protein [Candidatus Caldarchaeum sp.]MCS7136880.1 hypothetical protein [Candidatus Caldarchaeum sp.]MDW7977874.1 hypothetical protein [Candidatus Caldarchaeum sp.]MDW8360290.1 hypothetical protein [Candidatus Caldarchaeum sp.]
MSVRLKKQFIKLLDKDREFRYTVAGYIGLSDLLKASERLQTTGQKLDGAQTRVWGRF